MAVAVAKKHQALQKAPARKSYHATMMVVRLEEWCVDAESPEEARLLLAAGEGERCQAGEKLFIEVDRLLD
jgi:hypothetical protein